MNLPARCPPFGVPQFTNTLKRGHQTRRQFVLAMRCAFTAAALPLVGCTRAPTFDIVGSSFPAWLLCLILGILLTVLARWLLLRAKIVLALPILVYPCLAALFTFLIWLVFFS
jgi:fructose-specific phosphotransferase system IIC component